MVNTIRIQPRTKPHQSESERIPDRREIRPRKLNQLKEQREQDRTKRDNRHTQDGVEPQPVLKHLADPFTVSCRLKPRNVLHKRRAQAHIRQPEIPCQGEGNRPESKPLDPEEVNRDGDKEEHVQD